MKGLIYKNMQWRQLSAQLEGQSWNLNWHYIHSVNKSSKKAMEKTINWRPKKKRSTYTQWFDP
jgi:hypothetical protein